MLDGLKDQLKISVKTHGLLTNSDTSPKLQGLKDIVDGLTANGFWHLQLSVLIQAYPKARGPFVAWLLSRNIFLGFHEVLKRFVPIRRANKGKCIKSSAAVMTDDALLLTSLESSCDVEQMEEIISIFSPVFDGSLRAWCSRSRPDALVDVSRRETVRYMVRSTSFVHPLLSSCFEFILMKLGYKPSTVDSNDNLIRPFVSMYFGAAYITWRSTPPMFSPSLDKRFWSTLRSRVDSLIEDRNKSESVQVDVRVETEMNKLLKEDSTLLLRGFDSVTQTLSCCRTISIMPLRELGIY
ncbi:hypothetical protein ACFE04_014500 [Oxalis oulophora]